MLSHGSLPADSTAKIRSLIAVEQAAHSARLLRRAANADQFSPIAHPGPTASAATSAPREERSAAGGPQLAKITRTTSTPSDTAPRASRARDAEQTPQEIAARRVRVFALQDTAARLLDDERVCTCGKRPAYDGGRQKRKSRLDIKQGEHAAYYAGLERCGSVWSCPVCASRIASKRREELFEAGRVHVERGGQVYMLTLTVPHAHDDLAHVLTDQLLEAYNRFTSGRGAFSQAFRDGYTKAGRYRPATVANVGYLGQVRALEVTHGRHGWHPHLHVLLFLDGSLGDTTPDSDRVEGANWDAIFNRWAEACEKVGLSTPNESACSLQDGKKAFSYISKWGPADELARAHTKKARAGGRTPWQLLEVATALRGTAQGRRAGRLFQEFFRSFKGRRQLVWSRGLRAALGLGEVVEDDQAVQQSADDWDPIERQNDPVVVSISWDSWSLVKRFRERAQLLYVAEVGGAEAVKRFVGHLRRRVLGLDFHRAV